MQTAVGFVGLGIMGLPMAKNLAAKGFSVVAFDIDAERVKLAGASNILGASIADIGNQCTVVFTSLPNGKIAKMAITETGGLSSYLAEGSIVVDTSSITPNESRYIAAELEKRGIDFLDAPVSGGEPKAIDGTLAFMVGGKQAAFEKVMPYLKAMGSSFVRIGESGSGSITKLVNQIIVNLNIAVLGEALVFAQKAGADPELVFQAIRNGLAGSTVMEAKTPMILARDFKPGGKLSINRKDIGNVLETAHELEIPVPFTAQLFEIMQSLKAKGLMEEDHAALVKHFEELARLNP
nr:NAD(P)-binding domain-containing protein [uncultured Sphaerochaeta sp.]